MCIRDSPKTPKPLIWTCWRICILSLDELVITMQTPEHLDDYLKYADLYDNPNPIMAQYCRMYYIQEYINLKKKSEHGLHPNESILIASVLKKTEQAKEKIKCTVEGRKQMVEKELSRMYERAMEYVPTDDADKDCLRRRLLVLMDLIKVLTVFAPLASKWEDRGKLFVTRL
eukprot:TRINITY_DN8541_c0_g1_i6.p1 TRINITY_DN8541_c0_g1~~TRINITY_DN8541_c0_g1_i6.p1  ORF type:complete len:172 (-),score=16.49 TRINITY_DN8541_c0_g1_i6:450-965(-)